MTVEVIQFDFHMMTSHYFIIDSLSDSQNPLIFDSPSDIGQCGDSDMFDSVRCQRGSERWSLCFSPLLCMQWSGVEASTLLQHRQQSKGFYSTACAAVEKRWS